MKTINRVVAMTSLAAISMARVAAFTVAALSTTIVSADVANAAAPALSFGGYYQDSTPKVSPDGLTVGQCQGTDTCGLIFKLVPAGKQLIVTKVSCSITINEGYPLPLNLLTLRHSSIVAVHHMPAIATGSPQSFAVSETTLQLVDSGDHVVILMKFSEAASVLPDCTIAGQLIDAQ